MKSNLEKLKEKKEIKSLKSFLNFLNKLLNKSHYFLSIPHNLNNHNHILNNPYLQTLKALIILSNNLNNPNRYKTNPFRSNTSLNSNPSIPYPKVCLLFLTLINSTNYPT